MGVLQEAGVVVEVAGSRALERGSTLQTLQLYITSSLLPTQMLPCVHVRERLLRSRGTVGRHGANHVDGRPGGPAATGVEQELGGPVVTPSPRRAGGRPGAPTGSRPRTAPGVRQDGVAVAEPGRLRPARREARVVAQLPSTVQAPRLLGALRRHRGRRRVGRPGPRRRRRAPPRASRATAATSRPCSMRWTPCRWPPARSRDLPRASPTTGDEFGAWDRMLGDPPYRRVAGVVPATSLDAGTGFADRRSEAAAAGRRGPPRARRLPCRQPARRPRPGVVWVVDWPWASVGAHWLDALTYLLDTVVRGEDVDVEHHLATHPVFADLPAASGRRRARRARGHVLRAGLRPGTAEHADHP